MFSTEATKEIERFRANGEFTDYMLLCGGQKIQVHRLILCSHSMVFHAACTSSFKEGGGEYEIEDFAFDMVERMVSYMYTGDYNEVVAQPGSKEPVDHGNNLSIDAIMFALADKYAIKGLENMAAQKYWKTLMREPGLFHFFDSIPDVYTLTVPSTRSLREKVVMFAREKLPGAFEETGVRGWFDAVVADVPDFTKDLVTSFLEHPIMGRCGGCGRSKPVSVEVLQCRCLNCGKGGATVWN